MKKREEIREARIFSIIMLSLILAVSVAMWARAKNIGRISYQDHIDDTAVTVDGRDYKFRDLAVYLACQEMATEKQAKIYDPDDTSKFWNVHANGVFIRLESKKQAMELAVHDIIFFQMASEGSISLSPDEAEYAENEKMDFWNDLQEEGQARIGLSEEEAGRAFERMALAQKQQQILSEQQGVDSREYNVDGGYYEELKKKHTYEINEKLWSRLNFGNIILE